MGAMSHKRDRQFVVHEPSRARLRRVFCFSRAGRVRKVCSAKAETGDPDPGVRVSDHARPKRGACRRERREQSRSTDGRANFKGSLWWRAMVESAATEFVFRFSPQFRGTEFQVVMSFGTSFRSKAFGPPNLCCSPGSLCSQTSRAHQHAGGEEIGYFAPGKAGSNPAFGVTYRGSGLARAVASRVPVLSQERTCVAIIENRF